MMSYQIETWLCPSCLIETSDSPHRRLDDSWCDTHPSLSPSFDVANFSSRPAPRWTQADRPKQAKVVNHSPEELERRAALRRTTQRNYRQRVRAKEREAQGLPAEQLAPEKMAKPVAQKADPSPPTPIEPAIQVSEELVVVPAAALQVYWEQFLTARNGPAAQDARAAILTALQAAQ